MFGHKTKPLTVLQVISKLRKIASVSSQDEKMKLMEKLFVTASATEIRYIVRSLQGKLRIGLAEQTILICLGKLFSDEYGKSENRNTSEKAVATVKEVFSFLPVYDKLIEALVESDGTDGIEDKCKVSSGIPLKPMLAKPTNGISVIFDRFAEVDFTCEYKYDGERAQIHLLPDGKVEIYSRNSENQTEKYPDIVPILSKILHPNKKVKTFILDSEVVAYDDKAGELLPFQTLSKRKRKNVTVDNITVPVIICAFDLLFLNGESLLRKSLNERRQLLQEHFIEVENKFAFAKSLDSSLKQHNEDEEQLMNFLNQAVKDKCEGLMVKTLHDTYQPAKRSLNWLKLKKDYMNGLSDSLDLVVIGAFYGKGKRTGKYGSFILASYNDSNETFESITKVGTGFSDEFLQESTDTLKETTTEEKPFNVLCDLKADVWFKPSQVWEVKAADLSISPIHKSGIGLINDSKGIALRFPRFLRIREDKPIDQATNRNQVIDMYNQQSLRVDDKNDDDFF